MLAGGSFIFTLMYFMHRTFQMAFLMNLKSPEAERYTRFPTPGA